MEGQKKGCNRKKQPRQAKAKGGSQGAGSCAKLRAVTEVPEHQGSRAQAMCREQQLGRGSRAGTEAAGSGRAGSRDAGSSRAGTEIAGMREQQG